MQKYDIFWRLVLFPKLIILCYKVECIQCKWQNARLIKVLNCNFVTVNDAKNSVGNLNAREEGGLTRGLRRSRNWRFLFDLSNWHLHIIVFVFIFIVLTRKTWEAIHSWCSPQSNPFFFFLAKFIGRGNNGKMLIKKNPLLKFPSQLYRIKLEPLISTMHKINYLFGGDFT